MGSCASKFGLADKDDNNPPAAPDKDEFVHVIAETKVISPILEKSMAEQHALGIIEGINTDIAEETRRMSLSSLLHENEGKVAVGAGGIPSEKVKPEVQGSEKTISEQDEAAQHTESSDSVPGKVAVEAGGIPSEKVKPELQGSENIISEQDEAAIHTEAGDSLPGKVAVEAGGTPSENVKPELSKKIISEQDEAAHHTEEGYSVPGGLSEPDLTAAHDGEETYGKKLEPPVEADTEKRHSNDTIITEDKKSDVSIAGSTPKLEILQPEPYVDAKNAVSECLDTEEVSDPAARVTEESNTENPKLKTGQIVLPEKEEAPPEAVAVNKSAEMQPTCPENSAAATPESVETKSSKKGEKLENEPDQIPVMETKLFEEKCSETGAENSRNQKTSEVGQEKHMGSMIKLGVVEGGSPLLPTESLSDRGDGKIYDAEKLK